MQEFDLKPQLKGFENFDFETDQVQLTRSTGLEALISQNEDLAARLRVSIRNLTGVEMQNQSMKTELDQLQLRLSATQDQLLIWKEKESIWQERIQAAETELQQMKARFPDYLSMEEKLDRYRRYHERIKSQVKPYIHELKTYSESLAAEINQLTQELDNKEAINRDLIHKNSQLDARINQVLVAHQQIQIDLTESFEKERKEFIGEIELLKLSNQELEKKSNQLDESLEANDLLQNQIVSMKHRMDEFQNNHEKEIKQLREIHMLDKRNLTEKTLSLEDQIKQTQTLQNANSEYQMRLEQTEEQLTSLRFLWSAKSEEVDKLRMANQALERLNAELSVKLNEKTKGMI